MSVLKKGIAILLVLLMIFSSLTAACAVSPISPLIAALAEGELEPATNLPSIYIDLENGTPLDSVGKDVYVNGTVSVVGDGENPDIIAQAGGLKGRGNYSWAAPKKPYNLKFASKVDLLGMGAAKKWVLISNYWDKTMLRNYITLMLAYELGLNHAVEVRFADVYVNGRYQGNYLVTEKVEIGKERINIDDTNDGVLFEIEQAYRHGGGSQCQYCHQVGSGVHLTYKEPEAADLTEEKMNYIMETTNTFLDKLDASLRKGYSEYSKYIDVDSFIEWYLVNEFCKNYDSQFVTSCYCYYDPADGKLHMGPPWDYDTCYGNQDPGGYGRPEGFYIRNGAPWFRILFEDSRFEELVRERWTKAKKDGVISGVLSNVIEGAELIDASQKLNFQAWPGMLTDSGPKGNGEGYYFTTHKEEVDYLKRFVAIRSIWLDEQFNTEPDSSVNKVDNLNILAKGLLMDNSMTIDPAYIDKAYMLYDSLTPAEAAMLDDDVSKLFSDMEVYLVESAIRSAAAVTSYAEKAVVENARRLYSELADDSKPRVSNYADLIKAEEMIKRLADEIGIGNVTKAELTFMVNKESVSAPDGFGNEGFDRLFDGDTGTKYCTGADLPLSISWEMAEPAAVTVYALATANDSPERDPKAWTLEGSKDGEKWTVLSKVSDGALSEERFSFKEFFCSSSDKYKYYRLNITETRGGSIFQLSEIMLGGNENENVAEVVSAIDAIGAVTDLSGRPAVENARKLYDGLSAAERLMVNNYDKLLAAEIVIANLIGVDAEIQGVIDAISAFPEEVKLEDETAVSDARKAYDALTPARRTLVNNYNKLLIAEQKLATLIEERDNKEAADAVDELIGKIGEVTGPEQLPFIEAARAGYDKLTFAQKALVTKYDILKAAEKTLAEIYKVPQTIRAIDAISDPVTYRDAPAAVAARRLYDSLAEEDKKQVENYEKLVSAEKSLDALHSLFNVEVHQQQGHEYCNGYDSTPWMNKDNLNEEQIEQSLSAMADEIKYLYTHKGYSMGVLDGYYEIGHHGGYVIVQSDVRKYGTMIESDDVGNPWGAGGRYWSCVISPFVGMAFGVNGYFTTPIFNYDMPLGDAFLYDGRMYQVYAACTKSYEDTPLVKDTCPEIERVEMFPGSGDAENNNTFAYTYAAYSQKNKWDDRVLGVPQTDVQLSSDGSVKYQRFISNDGVAYIAGDSAVIASAEPSGGNPEGAYIVSGAVAEVLTAQFGADGEIFDKTGAALSDEKQNNGKIIQVFSDGLVIIDETGGRFVEGSAVADIEAAADTDELIAAIGDNVTLDSKANIEAARTAYAALSEVQQTLVKLYDKLVKAEARLADLTAAAAVADMILALPKLENWDNATFEETYRLVCAAMDAYEALTPEQEVFVPIDLVDELEYLYDIAQDWDWIPPKPDLLLGDVDMNKTIDVNDMTALKAFIMSGIWTDEVFAIANMDGNETLDVNDMTSLKMVIMSQGAD